MTTDGPVPPSREHLERIEKFLQMMQERRNERASAQTDSADNGDETAEVPKPEAAESSDEAPSIPADVAAAMKPGPHRDAAPNDENRLSSPAPASGPWADSIITVPLPSGGRWQPDGNVRTTPVGTVEVRALTARDEILLHDPTALLDGTAVRDILARCVHGVKDPQQLPYPDVRVLMMAVRIATYGPEWKLEADCPSCARRQEITLDARTLLAGVEAIPEDDTRIVIDGTEFRLRPMPAWWAHRYAAFVTEEARMMSATMRSDMEEGAKQKKLAEILARTHQETIRAISRGCVQAIVFADGNEERDPDRIEELVSSLPAGAWRQLRERAEALTRAGLPNRVGVTCPGCGHPFELEPPYDPAAFFSVR